MRFLNVSNKELIHIEQIFGNFYYIDNLEEVDYRDFLFDFIQFYNKYFPTIYTYGFIFDNNQNIKFQKREKVNGKVRD